MRPSCTSPRLQSDPGGPEAPRLQLPAALALSSREIRCVIPLIRHPQLRSNPTVLPSPSAYSNQRVDLRRPRGFSPPRRAAQKSSRACCISVPEGVRRVSNNGRHSRPTLRREPVRLVDRSLSRCALHTPRRSPPISSRAASLRPLPSRRCASALAATLDLKALLHRWVRNNRQLLPVDDCPLLPGLRSPPGFWPARNDSTRHVSASAQLDPYRRCLHSVAAASHRSLRSRDRPPFFSAHQPRASLPSVFRLGVCPERSVCNPKTADPLGVCDVKELG
jgi:hypothetical protein